MLLDRRHRVRIDRVAGVQQDGRLDASRAQRMRIRDIRDRDDIGTARHHRARDRDEPESVGVRLQGGDQSHPWADEATDLADIAGDRPEIDLESIRSVKSFQGEADVGHRVTKLENTPVAQRCRTTI